MRVVLDASSLVSAMLKADSIPRQAVNHIVSHPGRLVVSQAVQEEYYEVVLRPKFDRFIPAQRRLRILSDVMDAAARVEPSVHVCECADPDDKYLSLALAAAAGVIVSSDRRHLLPLHPWRGVSILSPGDYLRRHAAF